MSGGSANFKAFTSYCEIVYQKLDTACGLKENQCSVKSCIYIASGSVILAYTEVVHYVGPGRHHFLIFVFPALAFLRMVREGVSIGFYFAELTEIFQ